LNGLGVVRLLEAIREACPRARLFQASSSEIFGNTLANPQTEATVLAPRSPYGIAKAYAHWMVQEYRQRHHLYACSGILYNHESPRRSPAFVTRKITQGVARIKKGEAGELRLGNLEAVRDWGFAGDYVRAMWLALRSDHPGDYIIATGKTHTVREFCETAFACAGLDYRAYVVPDADPPRPPETAILVGDPAKAERELGWQREVDFKGLVRLMIDADLHRS
jgi:GDPmannose 4,6-dehydratase